MPSAANSWTSVVLISSASNEGAKIDPSGLESRGLTWIALEVRSAFLEILQ
jgi:hypothetical protein